jgi:Alginate lyase
MSILRSIPFKSIYCLAILAGLFFMCSASKSIALPLSIKKQAEEILKKQIMEEAEWALKQEPITVTASTSNRSAGEKNDFYSEGDYWWPNPQNPDCPYIQKDGLTNPDNFVAHRFAMIRFSQIIGSLASAYKITKNKKYVKHAVLHLKAWFLNPETRMNPNLQFAQAIKGLFTGRGIGIIDTVHLMDVVQGILVMQSKINEADLVAIKNWFVDYLTWLMSHPNGKAEMAAKNNHGTCFTMQVASFAKLTNNQQLLDFCVNRYKTVLLPAQMATNGSFPLEMARTKPYGYSLFNLDAMTTLCQILSTPQDNLWAYETADGKSIKKGISFIYPFIADKSKWELKPDVMYWENWPVAQPALLFGANAYQENDWFLTWKKLDHQPKVAEVIRNLPVKYPLIWIN